ncbi:hypothetical protein L6164_003013 [Bauhinia variegata]|uniref:Uncharacterized protein n=1 Tax=Bauhinia variegata TaxID=167791 RepID=A0ACB9Q1G6_BAUVA|nr:hypothetical protein L6164_003013 [Bauhinia variegata]
MDYRSSGTKSLVSQGKANENDDLAFQLIDGNGNFNDMKLKDFAKEVGLHQCGRSYAVVAIMGPQNSGKSTLLNLLFHTKFKMMDDSDGRYQITQGIWIGRCPDIKPLTLVLDMEGTDGSERGEDDVAFEKQSALLALAVADVVLINLWCQDIGREHAANKPLLRAVFQQVLVQFGDKQRRITLMFVVRDKTKSPENVLEAYLKEDIEKIWASIIKPSETSNLQLHNFFKVEVVFLPNYEEREEEFKLTVYNLKKRFENSTAPGGLADTGDDKVPASWFPVIAQNIWNDILENKDLDLPAHKVMVATVCCEDIINELQDSFEINEDWRNLRNNAQFCFLPDFGKIVNSILSTYVSEYDANTPYLEEEVTNAKREELLNKLLQVVEPVYQAMVNRLRLEHLKKFMEAIDNNSDDEQNKFSTVNAQIEYCLLEFDKECAAIKVGGAKLDTFKARAKLRRDMNSYTATKHEDKLAFKIRRLYEPKLKQELSGSVGYLLREEADLTWSKIRGHFKSVMESILSGFNHTLSEFDVDEEWKKKKIENIQTYAKDVVEAKAREESGRAKFHMISKFVKLFKYDNDSSTCDWKDDEIEAAAKDALYTPLKLLAGLAAIRLEDDEADDNIQDILSSALLGSGDQKASKELDSPSWEKVPSFRTLITPIECKQLWTEYLIEAGDAIDQTLKDLEEKEKKKPALEQIAEKILSIITAEQII